MTDDVVSWHNKIAKHFEQRYANGKLFRDRFQVWSQFLLRFCARSSHGTALDLGCGAGTFSILLARQCRKLVCVDGSERMAQLCREKLVEVPHADAEVIVEDLNKFCLSASSRFDVICCSSVLEYMDNLDATLVNIGRCLEKDGVLLFSVPNGDSYYRQFERFVFSVTGKPSYYRYVKNVLPLSDVRHLLDSSGLQYLESEYLTNAPVFGSVLGLLGARRSKSLILVACKIQSSTTTI